MFLLSFLFLANVAYAQIKFYGINTIIDNDGKSNVQLSLTFLEPQENFKFTIFGHIDDFNASSTAGPVVCSVKVSQASFVDCQLQLTNQSKTIDLTFTTSDFIKKLDDSFVFSGDFSLNQNIDEVLSSVKLPEGTVLPEATKTQYGRTFFPENPSITSDGRRIVVFWRQYNASTGQALKFQLIYESLKGNVIELWQVAIIVGIIAILAVYYILSRMRKPQEVILSVLDEYEKKVMDAIVAAGGTAYQRKVVQETNLSKAKVSRVVRSLEKRGIIEIEHLGRTNRLKLSKKKLV
jgi:uncharacterized membrane protein